MLKVKTSKNITYESHHDNRLHINNPFKIKPIDYKYLINKYSNRLQKM